jgi:hypothetical protein
MAITSTFYTGAVDNVAWARGSGRLGFSYVAHGANDCKVTTVGTGTRTVRVAAGAISGAGVTDVNDSPVDISLPNVTSGSKWFLIIADRVWETTNATTFDYIEGTSTRQLPPRTVDPGVQDQQPLALVRIQAGQTLPQEIIDLRVIGSNNGVMVGFDELCLSYLTDVGTVVRIGETEYVRTISGVGAAQWVINAPAQTGTIGYLISGGNPAYGRYSGAYPANIRYSLKDGRVTLSGMVKRIAATATVSNGQDFPITQPIPAEIRPAQITDGVIGTAAASFLSTHAATELIYKSSDSRIYVRHRRYLGDSSSLPITQNSWWVSLEGVSWLV